MSSELESGMRRVGSLDEALRRAREFGTPTYLILAEEVERLDELVEEAWSLISGVTLASVQWHDEAKAWADRYEGKP